MQHKKTIIHIGLHKTASTFLQEVFFPKASTYTYLTRPYTQHNFAFNKLQLSDDSLFDYAEIEAELRKINADRLLISDEAFSGKPHGFGYINRTLIAQRLKKIFPDAEIILFLRGQQSILASHYNMWVKGYQAGLRNIDDFIWRPSNNYTYENYRAKKSPDINSLYWNSNKFYLHLDCFKYYELVSCYKKLFDKVHVFLYEDFITQKRKVLTDLENILEEQLEFSDEVLNRKKNDSLDNKKLQQKIVQNKVETVVKNKYLRKILKVYSQFRPGHPTDNTAYVDGVTKGFYEANNLKLIQNYPEIGIQNYPNDYRILNKE